VVKRWAVGHCLKIVGSELGSEFHLKRNPANVGRGILKIMKRIFTSVILLAFSGLGFSRATAILESPRKFDEFGNVNCEVELARLDSFAIDLQNQPDSVGYVIVYGGRNGRRNDAKARAARMYYYLVHSRGVDGKRVVTADGGFRETLVAELWVTQ
jgi:hypothetical protein